MKKFAFLASASMIFLLWSLPVHADQDPQDLQAFYAKHGVTAGGKLVGLYQQETSPWPGEIATSLSERLKDDGFTVCRLSSDELCRPSILNREMLPELVIDDIATVPVGAVAAISEYVAGGGHLIALGGPAFSNLQYRFGDVWRSREELLSKIEAQLVVHVLPLPQQAESWAPSRDPQSAPSTLQIVAGDGQLAQSVSPVYQFTFNFTHWCGFSAQPLMVPNQDALTVFWAKGDENAHQLSVEWDERDGSRWIAVLNLEPHWRHYMLSEKAFTAWPHPSVPRRFGSSDHLRLQNATKLQFGLSENFTEEPPGQSYEISVAGVGTAEMPAEAVRAFAVTPQTRFEFPQIETISPAYKLFPVTNLKTVTTTDECPEAIAAADLPTPRTTMGLVARVQGTGFNKQRATRYLPLLECRDDRGRFTAAAAALVLSATGAERSTCTLSVPVTDPVFFNASTTQQWLVKIIHWLDHGVYLAEGGSEYYVSFGNEDIPVGAVVANLNSQSQYVKVISTVTDAAGNVIVTRSFQGAVMPGSRQKFEASWSVPAVGNGVYQVSTLLEQNGQRIDRVSHEFRILSPSPHPDFVTVHNGQFWLDGKPWYPFGVNYMPSSGIGREDHDLWENFFSTQAYDPEVIERDLEDVKAMGFNMISTLVHADNSNELANRNILDLLARCRSLGLKVNLAICSNSPLHFDWNLEKSWIQALHLPGNDTVFAYDIDWEAHWGSQAMRRQYDALWRDWIAQHYGSLQKAEDAWHFQAPREEGDVTNPSDEQFTSEGPAHAMVIDYRQFLNELLSERHEWERRAIHSIDPMHSVSFRMAYSGGAVAPGMNWTAYDLVGLKNAIDFFAPEGYSIIRNDQEHCTLYGLFTIAYARAVNPDLPVIFAEFGISCINLASLSDDPTAEQNAADEYSNFFHMALRGGANGVVCWFFPGGYRVGEGSDFGIINPDRSWRPVTYLIHRIAPLMTAPRQVPQPDVVIPIVLDHYEGSTPEIYQDIKDQWKKIVDAGQLPGLSFTH